VRAAVGATGTGVRAKAARTRSIGEASEAKAGSCAAARHCSAPVGGMTVAFPARPFDNSERNKYIRRS
jgi:hypothetical protein